ncbi:MAG: hypothetical protein M3552_18085 [Planctomycetota bacterium]|nr:hypothetical protein [Planctomycetota bacterium]
MIRAMFFACGLFTALCGGLLFFVDRIELTDYAGRRMREATGPVAQAAPGPMQNGLRLIYVVPRTESRSVERQVVDPPDWSAFCLLSIGVVTVLYAFAIPGRRNDEDEDEG